LQTKNVFITHDCVLMNVAHENFSVSVKDSKPQTGCVKQTIFVLVLQDITFIVISAYHTL